MLRCGGVLGRGGVLGYGGVLGCCAGVPWGVLECLGVEGCWGVEERLGVEGGWVCRCEDPGPSVPFIVHALFVMIGLATLLGPGQTAAPTFSGPKIEDNLLQRTIRVTFFPLKFRTSFGTHVWGPVSFNEPLGPPIT